MGQEISEIRGKKAHEEHSDSYRKGGGEGHPMRASFTRCPWACRACCDDQLAGSILKDVAGLPLFLYLNTRTCFFF